MAPAGSGESRLFVAGEAEAACGTRPRESRSRALLRQDIGEIDEQCARSWSPECFWTRDVAREQCPRAMHPLADSALRRLGSTTSMREARKLRHLARAPPQARWLSAAPSPASEHRAHEHRPLARAGTCPTAYTPRAGRGAVGRQRPAAPPRGDRAPPPAAAPRSRTRAGTSPSAATFPSGEGVCPITVAYARVSRTHPQPEATGRADLRQTLRICA